MNENYLIKSQVNQVNDPLNSAYQELKKRIVSRADEKQNQIKEILTKNAWIKL